MSTALTLSTAPAALQAFAASPLMRDTRGSAEIAVSAFTELSAACNLHLDAKATTPEHFSEILEVLALSFPSFRISEISPAFRAYSAGLLAVDKEEIKTYGKPLRPDQIVMILDAYRATGASVEKARMVAALQAPPPLKPEEEQHARNLSFARDVLFRWDRGRLPYTAWPQIPVAEALILEANRPEWFYTELQETAKQAVMALTEQQANDLHVHKIPAKLVSKKDPNSIDPDAIATFVDAGPAGIVPGLTFDAIWREECKMASGWRNACYLKLLLWQLIKPADVVRVAPAVIEAALQEGGQP